ncbi:MAG: TlyA family RNA methyltransferase [Thermodesulfobacteriota bacterium]|nr:TlyA family RNA methyltransferase [Thermodesulfobacteriota bacterium]
MSERPFHSDTKYYFKLRATIKLPVLAKELLRLDLLLLQKGLATSRNQAQALISTGKVRVEGHIIDKAGHRFSSDAQIELAENLNPYVSRGGLKLAHALEYFAVDVHGLVCMDVGASTGGFTDCLLQKGASKVYAVDVGYGQLDWRLRNDERVVPIERTNIRYLPPDVLDSQIYLATIDTSFISLRLVIPSILPFMHRESRIIALVKPQFEVGKGKVGKGGIVKDPKLHHEVLDRLILFCNKLKLTVIGVTPSPILGAKGNREFLMLMEYP